MRTLVLIVGIFLTVYQTSFTQEFTFSMEVSGDTILLGNYIELSYTIENAKGKFEAPSFKGLDIIAGPNYSSSISIVNGEMKSMESYSYYLSPPEVGIYYIDPAYFLKDGQTYESKPLEIIALPNPDGIKTNPQQKIFKESFGVEGLKKNDGPKKKKRKLKKI